MGAVLQAGVRLRFHYLFPGTRLFRRQGNRRAVRPVLADCRFICWGGILLPGAQAGGFVVLLRLARLARLAMVSKGSRRLFDRLGRIAIVAAGVLVTGSVVAYYAEHPTNPEFATVGDALWWGIVTLTTVGYGDIVPKTPAGRFAAVAIMITGVAVLGLLAGSLASFFRLDGGETAAGEPTSTAATSNDAALQALATEVSALRRQLEALTERLTGVPPT